jgi:hypothetical protein
MAPRYPNRRIELPPHAPARQFPDPGYKLDMHRSLPLAIGTSTLALLAASPAANAASFQCDASALRVTVATAPAQEPITANRGAATCAPQEAGGALPATPLAVAGGALFARTTFTGADTLSQVAGASAGLGELSVALPLPALPALDLSALPGGGVLAVPGIGTVDIRPALAALIAPSGPLLALQGVTAEASASCQAGSPSVTGTSRLGALSVLGTKLSTTDAADRNLGLDSQSIDPSDIDISKALAPAGDLALLQATLQPILDTLPNVEVPAIALRVRTTPGAQIVAGEKLTRRALQIQIELGGMALLDAVVGEATVDATGVSCGSLAAAALGLGPGKSACTTRRLTLIDVVQRGNKVKLQGAADPRRFAGSSVRIVSRWNGKTITTRKVAKSGLFSATLKLPPRAIRHTNRARYQAVIGHERSLSLKLDRRMIVTAVRKAGTRKVTLSGRVSRPLGTPVQEISVTRRISCGNVRVVARFKPDSNGRFKVTLKAPRTDRVYTFRFRTKVRYSTAFTRLFRTYTLPQYVVGS